MKICLGGAQFGMDYGFHNRRGRVGLTELNKILSIAKASGVRAIDTAVGYGVSEAALGACGIDGWLVTTKVSLSPECRDVKQSVLNQIAQSLERMRIDKMHAVLLHNARVLNMLPPEEVLDALQTLKDRHYCDFIGISIYDPAELAKLEDLRVLDVCQTAVNILDRSLENSIWLPRLKEAGVSVHARSVFLQGSLLQSKARRPKALRAYEGFDSFDEWLLHQRCSPLQACFAYINSLDFIDYAIVGVDSAEQLVELLGASSYRLAEIPNFFLESRRHLLNPGNWSSS